MRFPVILLCVVANLYLAGAFVLPDDRNLQVEDEDGKLSTIELATKYGYRIEPHEVQTEDGYLLEVHRITGSGSTMYDKKLPPVLLMHGLFASSADWVLLGPGNALAYRLSDMGYDVWLGNVRGNRYSRKHVSYTPDMNQFWDFSWHEIAIYDLPAIVDYTLNVTGKEKLHYIGHSQGTTVFFVMCSERPAASTIVEPAAMHGSKAGPPVKHKGRHRKKQKYNAIRSQMEFYFSDANLTKDRYLGQQIKSDPFIPLQEFLKFNRIKQLTDNVEDIVTALKNSELLQLSDDRSKVRRTTEPTERPNCEQCTIYVESLPPKADHDWVRNVFSAYGKVAYVSLPKFKYSKKIKEFGFVEFEEESSVQKALKTFQAFGGVLTYEDTDPGKLVSITSFGKEKEEEEAVGVAEKVEGDKDVKDEDDTVKAGKEEDEEEPPPAKRIRTDNGDSSDSANGGGSGSENEVVEVDGGAVKREGGEAKKKKRHRKGTSGVKKEIQQDDKVYELKVMPKKEWRRLRNKYLNLQRTVAKNMKKLFSDSNKFSKPSQSRTPNPSTAVSKTVKSSPRVNFYGALTDEEAAAEATKLEEQEQPVKQPLFSFEPGLIVNIKFRVPCANVKDFKAELKQFSYVKYIDLKETDVETFVRVDKPSSANQLVKEYNSAEYSAQILSGEREKSYWDKIKQDREDKLNKKIKVEKLRGRTKLMKKVNTHIKFDEDD